MQRSTIGARERGLSNLAQDGLHELILAAFGRARIDVDLEHLAPDEGSQHLAARVRRLTGDGRERFEGETLADHGRGLDEPPIVFAKRVEPRRDQGVERVRHGNVGGVALHLVAAVPGGHEVAAVDQHAHRLDRVERDALGTTGDCPHRVLRNARESATNHLRHLLRLERLELHRRQAAHVGAPSRAPLVDLRTSQRYHEDRPVAGPIEQLLDEIEHALVRPLHVLEDEHRRAAIGDALEECAPHGEELVARPGRHGLERQQPSQPGLDPAPLLFIGDPLGERGLQPLLGHRWFVRFGDAGAAADHLRERPVADAVAVRGRSADMPPDRLDDAIDVLLELPHQPALADAALADD